MKSFVASTLLVFSAVVFSQEKPKTPAIPAADINEACALNFPKLKPIFTQRPGLYQAFRAPEQDLRARTLKQAVILKNGTEIRMIKSGCSHYIFVINIRPKQMVNNEGQYLWELAAANLKLIPVVKDEKFNLTLILNALDKRNWGAITNENNFYKLPCEGGAFCTLRAVYENNLPRDIEIIYDKTL